MGENPIQKDANRATDSESWAGAGILYSTRWYPFFINENPNPPAMLGRME